jgi:hypothetical protein
MSGRSLALLCIPAFWLSAVADQGLAPRIQMFGASPSFLLVTAVVLSLFSRPAGGAFWGFLSGLLFGALSGANLVAYVISRTITGFCVSSTRILGIDVGAILAMVIVFFATIFSSAILIFLAPRPDFANFLGATMISAIYNGVIAVPFYSLLKRSSKFSAR